MGRQHNIGENSDLGSAAIQKLIGDYGDWYERDPIARFVTSPSATVLAMNAAARVLVSARYMQIDNLNHLRFPHTERIIDDPIKYALLGFESRHVYYLSLGHILAVAVSPATLGQAILHISASKLELEKSIDLEYIIEDFGISATEAPILDRLTHGASVKEMSRSLGLSVYAVRSNLQSIYSKLGVRSAAAAQSFILQTYFVFESIV